MDEQILAEERDYWIKEVKQRSSAVEAARAGGMPAHLVAAAELRLREAEERLASLQ